MGQDDSPGDDIPAGSGETAVPGGASPNGPDEGPGEGQVGRSVGCSLNRRGLMSHTPPHMEVGEWLSTMSSE